MNQAGGLVKNWLVLAVMALAGAGIYSLPPVILRGPLFKDILPVEAIFASSLVVHVDLSALVWMLAIGGMLWCRFYQQKYYLYYKAAFYTAAIGTALLALSPLTGNLNPLKNNYIPVMQNPVFFMGLGLFASGVVLQLLLTVLAASPWNIIKNRSDGALGIYTAAIITLTAAVCFIISAMQAPTFDHSNPTIFYEQLFWGGGHVLQAAYTALLIVVWFLLLGAAGYKNPLSDRFIYLIFGIILFTTIVTPFYYLFDDSTVMFAAYMRDSLGFSPLLAGAAVFYAIFRGSKNIQGENILKPFLILSVLLFGYGGVLAYLIKGTNVTIPAHYHGSIVGITLAFMGLVYHVLPQVGFRSPSGLMARLQPYIYGLGQAMHITGLAVMGGYGALRKDAASSQNIDTMLGKLLFFSGGSLAILGGLVFVLVALRAMRRGENQAG